jgi:ankyrin repeat protein
MRYLLFASALLLTPPAFGQIPPSQADLRVYSGLHAAAATGDPGQIARLIAAGQNVNAQDGHSRTPLHVAVHFRQQAAAQALLQGGADPNARDAQKYDIVTIAAVNNDVAMLKLALAGGCDPKAITSPYDGTALIAAAHLGHAEIVRVLIEAKAPLDHVNNLGWTALMESIVLGNGDKAHADTLEALVTAGANPNIADRQGVTPLGHARSRGYAAMVRILEAAGAK